jgi:hypothetical protein
MITIKTALAVNPSFVLAFGKLCRATLDRASTVPLLATLNALRRVEEEFRSSHAELLKKHSRTPSGAEEPVQVDFAGFKADLASVENADVSLPLSAKIKIPASLTLPDDRPLFSNGESFTVADLDILKDIVEIA